MMIMVTTIKKGPKPPRTPPSPFYNFLLCNTLLPLPPLMPDSDEIERMPTSRKKVAVAEKVKVSENLNKLLSKADKIFNKNNEQKPMFDDAVSLSKPDEMTIPQAQVIYKELNEGKLPEQLSFFPVKIVELITLGYMLQINEKVT